MVSATNYLMKELEMKQNLVGEGFLKPLAEDRIRVNIIGEIATAENFDEGNLYISYELLRPPYWGTDYGDEEGLELLGEDLEELNRFSSMTQISKSKLVLLKEEGAYGTVAHFSFPIDLQLSVHKELTQRRWPILLIQVNSIDSWERYRIEGYGFLEIPSKPGYHEIKVPTWKPEENNETKVFSFFLGGSLKVKNIKEIASTAFTSETGTETILNRFGLVTATSGDVKVCLNIATQSEDYMKESRAEHKEVAYKTKLEDYSQAREKKEATHPELMRNEFGLVNRFA